MFHKIINVIILVGCSVFIFFLNLRYEHIDLDRLFYTFTSIAILYAIFKILLEEAVSKKIKELKARYSFRKTTQLLFVIASIAVVIRVWVEDPQILLVSYGLVAAGVAIALQDVFKNFAGSFAIFLGSAYSVGDRIEINNKFGDVIDIGIFYTTLLELRGWVNGDQTTGRITLIPNGQVLSFPIQNYTKDHGFIWDEISLPITHDSNWKKAIEIISDIVKKETAEETKRAERGISRLEEKYYISKRNIEPAIFITPTDNWIMLHIRYVVAVEDRRFAQNELFKIILEILDNTPDITIASQTLTISPDL